MIRKSLEECKIKTECLEDFEKRKFLELFPE